MLSHERVQYPAGQGFFHVGTVASGGTHWDYLYDCGTTTGSAALRESVEEALSAGRLAQPGDDVAFLSHLHRDHINGLPRLHRLDRMPRTVVLPYLDDVARLITLAQDAAEAGRGDADAFVEDIVVEGTSALRRHLGVDRIFEVHSTEEPPGEPMDDPREEVPTVEETARLRFDSASPQGVRRGSDGVLAVSHAIPFIVSRTGWSWDTRRAKPVWLLKTHVDEGIPGARAAFLARLDQWRVRSGIAGTEPIERWLGDPHVRRMLVHRHPSALIEAYGGSPRLNATSMSLYSGPAERFERWEVIRAVGFFGREPGRYTHDFPDRLGWLGTGDACLARDANLDAFLDHFAEELETVGTLASPHHGSRENSDSALYEAVGAPHVVVAASPRARYGHPHPEMIHAAQLSRVRIIEVGEGESSQFTESVALRD